MNSISNVVERQLCTGCGACAFVEPSRFEMEDATDVGRRPFLKNNAEEEGGVGLSVCPGVGLTHDFASKEMEINTDLRDAWGPVLEVWEGYATNGEIRHSGSSGGAATALALFALEEQNYSGVLHTGVSGDNPLINETKYSNTRRQLESTTGSRYSPSSPCDGLSNVLEQENLSVFIGKPCDVAAVHKVARLDKNVAAKVGIKIAFFCAGAPATRGTIDLLDKVGIPDSSKVSNLRYRGNGWPGLWTAKYKDGQGNPQKSQLTYAESWGFLQSYRQWRCYICPDHTGEFSDISVGDPWYQDTKSDVIGKSLIIARTEKGKKAVLAAEAAGYVTLIQNDPTLLPRSQPNLLKTRANLWPRLLVLKLLGAGVPKYIGFPSFKFWVSELTFKEKRKSILSTITRIFRKQLNKRLLIERSNKSIKKDLL